MFKKICFITMIALLYFLPQSIQAQNKLSYTKVLQEVRAATVEIEGKRERVILDPIPEQLKEVGLINMRRNKKIPEVREGVSGQDNTHLVYSIPRGKELVLERGGIYYLYSRSPQGDYSQGTIIEEFKTRRFFWKVEIPQIPAKMKCIVWSKGNKPWYKIVPKEIESI